MCGIAAIFNAKRPDYLSYIHKMTNCIRHRGPDDEGSVFFSLNEQQAFCFGGNDTPDLVYNSNYAYSPRSSFTKPPNGVHAALGHRRLSIVDLSPAGHQPMCTNDGRYWIVYNGEVYNHIELRQKLETVGYNFHSHSDTEVILNAYSYWGNECLNYFNGMFAFVIFDQKQQTVFIARDRFGIKPLYYWVSPHGLIAFASEIKQFTVLPGWFGAINGQRVYDFLNWSLIDHTNETLFAGVNQLRGGEAISCALTDLTQKIEPYKWYQLKPEPFNDDFNQASTMFRDLLQDAVRLRLRADVDIGSCLSGGLDSSSIVCLANSQLKKQNAAHLQNTFSSCSHIRKFDEKEFIDEVVKSTGVKVHYTYPTIDSLFDTLNELIWNQDEPFVSTSIYAQDQVFRLVAKNRVKVILDGQGADEQLAGYYNFFAPLFANLFKTFQWHKLFCEIKATYKYHGSVVLRALTEMFNVLLPEFTLQHARRMIGRAYAKPDWICFKTLNAVPIDPNIELNSRSDSIHQLSYSLITTSYLPMLLHWEDRNSMASSVETRLPFLDYRLVEFVMGLPDKFKLADGITKRVLREGMIGSLPARIHTRMDKMGFVTPEEIWIKKEKTDSFRLALHHAVDMSQGVLKPIAKKKFEDIINGKERFSLFPCRLICFGIWMEKFKLRQ